MIAIIRKEGFCLHTDDRSVLFAMLRNQLDGVALPFAVVPSDQLAAVRALAAHHRLSHLVSACILANGLTQDPQLLAECRGDKVGVGLQIQAQTAEAQRIYAVLSRQNIPYIPLKGQIVRSFYPQPWMRNSRDVDILIPQHISIDICQTLCRENGYTVLSEGGHDITLRVSNGLWMEMHYRLMEDDSIPRLDTVWDRAVPCDGGAEHRMCDEDFYLYHLAHMAKHFHNGGCGIRPVMDLWLFMKQGYRNEALNELLQQYRLLQFTQAMEQLCKVWFGGDAHTDSTRRMEEFLLRGGVHGDEQFYHRVTLHNSQGKLRYLLTRAFPPVAQLKEQYPQLQKRPYLAPLMAIHRIGRVLFGKEKSSYQTQIQQIQKISKVDSQEVDLLWKDVGF